MGYVKNVKKYKNTKSVWIYVNVFTSRDSGWLTGEQTVLTGERAVLTGVAQQISYDDVIDDFASKKARKVKF